MELAKKNVLLNTMQLMWLLTQDWKFIKYLSIKRNGLAEIKMFI